MPDETRTTISAIVALQASNRGIGYQGNLLYRLPGDMQRLKNITTGHPLIMGRATHESIGRPLPGRTNIIVTRNTSYASEGCLIAYSLQEALDMAHSAPGSDEVFVFGGGTLYEEAFPLLERLYLTIIEGDKPADAFFPPYEEVFTRVIEKEDHGEHDPAFSYITLERN